MSDKVKDVLGMVPVVGSALGAVYGMFGKSENQRTKEAIELQEASNNRQADKAVQRQMEVYNKTASPSAMVRQYNEAGLNAALMYDKGGAGGMTTSGTGGSAGMGQISSDAARQSNAITAAMNVATLENLKANTEKTKAEATKIAGADTDKTKQETLSAKAKEILDNTQSEINRFTMKWNDNTYSPRIEMLNNEVKQTKAELVQELNAADISTATKNNVIKIAEQQMLQKVLENTKLKEQTKNIEATTDQIRQHIQNNTLGDWAQKVGIGKDIVQTLRMIFN